MPDGLQAYCRTCWAAYYRQRQAAKGITVRERPPVPTGHKFCRECGAVKPHSDWSRNRSSSDGFAVYCKECKARRDRLRYFKRQYDLTPDEVGTMVSEQFGICPICLSPGPQHVDHDHVTGQVRGVLCFTCNAALGQLRDSPAIARRAARYLEGEVWRPFPMAPGVFRLPS
jgi:NMD protein affecting ribosome stability and mRNA decay